MRAGRLIVAAFLFLGVHCPAGALALAHAMDSAHVHSHKNGAVHAHEHDAQDHHELEQHCVDGDPRLIDAGAKFAPSPVLPHPSLPFEAAAAAFAPRLIAPEVLDPPRASPQRLSTPSAAGRAPPA